MTNNLVVRGGTVIDGTGSPGVQADVAIADGRITEIGSGLTGDRTLDAGGCVVAPGFIDIHTHYDAQVFWDPALTPSCYHGVTTVVAGQLWLLDRADPTRAPRTSSPARSRTSKTWTSRRWRPASRGTSPRSPSTWRRSSGTAPA